MIKGKEWSNRLLAALGVLPGPALTPPQVVQTLVANQLATEALKLSEISAAGDPKSVAIRYYEHLSQGIDPVQIPESIQEAHTKLIAEESPSHEAIQAFYRALADPLIEGALSFASLDQAKKIFIAAGEAVTRDPGKFFWQDTLFHMSRYGLADLAQRVRNGLPGITDRETIEEMAIDYIMREPRPGAKVSDWIAMANKHIKNPSRKKEVIREILKKNLHRYEPHDPLWHTLCAEGHVSTEILEEATIGHIQEELGRPEAIFCDINSLIVRARQNIRSPSEQEEIIQRILHQLHDFGLIRKLAQRSMRIIFSSLSKGGHVSKRSIEYRVSNYIHHTITEFKELFYGTESEHLIGMANDHIEDSSAREGIIQDIRAVAKDRPWNAPGDFDGDI